MGTGDIHGHVPAEAHHALPGLLHPGFERAVWFISQIRLLYQIEDDAGKLAPSEREGFRQQNAPPIWDALKARAMQLQPKFLPKTTLGSALRYFLDEYDALTGYLRDGRFEIDNNLIYAVRGINQIMVQIDFASVRPRVSVSTRGA